MIGLQDIATGKYLDLLQNTSINFVYNNPFFQETIVEGDFSETSFSLANTAHNQSLLGILHKINVPILNRKFDYRLYVNGKYLFACELVYDNTTFDKTNDTEVIKVRINRNISRFLEITKDKYLKDTDDTVHTFVNAEKAQYFYWSVTEPTSSTYTVARFDILTTTGNIAIIGGVGASSKEALRLLAEEATGTFNVGGVSYEFWAETSGLTIKIYSDQSSNVISVTLNSVTALTRTTYYRLDLGQIIVADLIGSEVKFPHWRVKYQNNFIQANAIIQNNTIQNNVFPIIPCFNIGYILSRIANFTGYTFEGDFMDDTILQAVIVLNNIPLDAQADFIETFTLNIGQDTLIYKNHFPDLDIVDFIKALRGTFNLDVRVDDSSQKIRLDFKKDNFTEAKQNFTKYHELKSFGVQDRYNYIFKYPDEYADKSYEFLGTSLEEFRPLTVPDPKVYQDDQELVLTGNTLTFNNATPKVCFDFESSYASQYNDVENVNYEQLDDKFKLSLLLMTHEIPSPNVFYDSYCSPIDATETYSFVLSNMLADFWQSYIDFKQVAKKAEFLISLDSVSLQNFDTKRLAFIKNYDFLIESLRIQIENKENSLTKPAKVILYTKQ